MNDEILVVEDAHAIAEQAASLMQIAIADALVERGVARVALSGGGTPGPAYRALARSGLELARCAWFFVDERCVPPTHDRSNFAAARRDLFEPAGIPAERVFRMEGEREPAAAARDYAAALCREHGVALADAFDGPRSLVRLDLVVAGLGADGHTASLFPGTGAVHRDRELVTVVEPGGGLEARLTLSRPVLLAARRVLVLVSGTSKRAALLAARSPGPEDEVPARLYRAVPVGVVVWVVDRAAAGGDAG